MIAGQRIHFWYGDMKLLRLSLLTGHNQVLSVRIFWNLLVLGECFYRGKKGTQTVKAEDTGLGCYSQLTREGGSPKFSVQRERVVTYSYTM